MTLTLRIVAETALARRFRKGTSGAECWVPRSAHYITVRHPVVKGEDACVVVVIEDWWLEKNPWPDPPQGSLF